MSLARTMGRGFVWTTTGMAVGKVVGFANIFLILHVLTVYQYGLTELVFSVVSTIGLFLLPGLAATVTADLGVERGRQEHGRMKALFSEFFVLHCLLGICAWAVLFFGSTLVAELSGNVLIDKFFKIVSFSFLIAPFRTATVMLATVMVRYADQAFTSVVEEIAKCGWLLLFFFGLDRGADGLLYAYVLASVVTVLVFLPRTFSAYREFAHAPPVEQQPLWNILREHRKWSVATTYVNTAGNSVRLWIIKLFLGTEAVGLYAFATGIFSQLTGLITFQQALTPVVPLHVENKPFLARILTVTAKYQILSSLVLIAIGLIAVPTMIYIFFPHYLPGLPLALVMLIALLPNGIASILTPVYVALKEQRTLLVSICIKMVSMIVVLPIAIMMFGLYGTAVEYVVTMFLSTFERMYRARKMLPNFKLSFGMFTAFDTEERRLIKDILHKTKLYGVYSFFVR